MREVNFLRAETRRGSYFSSNSTWCMIYGGASNCKWFVEYKWRRCGSTRVHRNTERYLKNSWDMLDSWGPLHISCILQRANQTMGEKGLCSLWFCTSIMSAGFYHDIQNTISIQSIEMITNWDSIKLEAQSQSSWNVKMDDEKQN